MKKIIEQCEVMRLSDEPDGNGNVWSKNCIVHLPEKKIPVSINFGNDHIGEAFNFKQEDDLITADIELTHEIFQKFKIATYAVIGCRVLEPKGLEPESKNIDEMEITCIGLTPYPAVKVNPIKEK